jgi:hypothetical protein
MFYSPSTLGFYDNSIESPSDVIELTDEEYMALINNGSGNIAIGPSGKPEIAPSDYHTLNDTEDAWEITAENQAIIVEKDAAQKKTKDIKTARENSNLKELTIDQAYNLIDNRFSSVSTIEELKVAITDIFKQVIPHVLD